MNKSVFEMSHYVEINAKREVWLRNILKAMFDGKKLVSAIDVGCGDGYFSDLLAKLGLRVTGIDGRKSNIAEAQRKYPRIDFRILNVEDQEFRSIGRFDLVLCLGLLYHLENPFRAIRNISAVTKKHCIIESRVAPYRLPVTIFLDEFGKSEDQGLDYVALIPSETCLAKMLYQAGFKNVYAVKKLPDHPEFKRSFLKKRMRTCIVASKSVLNLPQLILLPNEDYRINWWRPSWYSWGYEKLRKLKRMLVKKEGK